MELNSASLARRERKTPPDEAFIPFGDRTDDKGRRLRKHVAALAAGVVATLELLAALFRSIENRFIYFPPQHSAPLNFAERYGGAVEELCLAAADGVKLSALYVPDQHSRKVIVWFHGNGEDLWTAAAALNFYATLGASVLAVDYRGYGKSEGSPNEEGIYRDADAAYDYLAQARQAKPEEIVLLGHSLGGVVAVDLAARRPCGGLIVESSLTSAREMAPRTLPIPLFSYKPRTQFDSLSKIPRVRAPVLIIHGTQDGTVPFSMGRRLYESAPQPKDFYAVEGAGHDDLLEIGGAPYVERLKSFVWAVPHGAGAAGSV